jgi:hypothetical protein
MTAPAYRTENVVRIKYGDAPEIWFNEVSIPAITFSHTKQVWPDKVQERVDIVAPLGIVECDLSGGGGETETTKPSTSRNLIASWTNRVRSGDEWIPAGDVVVDFKTNDYATIHFSLLIAPPFMTVKVDGVPSQRP